MQWRMWTLRRSCVSWHSPFVRRFTKHEEVKQKRSGKAFGWLILGGLFCSFFVSVLFLYFSGLLKNPNANKRRDLSNPLILSTLFYILSSLPSGGGICRPRFFRVANSPIPKREVFISLRVVTFCRPPSINLWCILLGCHGTNS